MENRNFFEELEQSVEELSLDDMEQVTGGKKRPFVKATGNNVNVRKGPGTEYGVVAQLGNHDEVAVSQSKYAEGWVCSKYAKGVWH